MHLVCNLPSDCPTCHPFHRKSLFYLHTHVVVVFQLNNNQLGWLGNISHCQVQIIPAAFHLQIQNQFWLARPVERARVELK